MKKFKPRFLKYTFFPLLIILSLSHISLPGVMGDFFAEDQDSNSVSLRSFKALLRKIRADADSDSKKGFNEIQEVLKKIEEGHLQKITGFVKSTSPNMKGIYDKYDATEKAVLKGTYDAAVTALTEVTQDLGDVTNKLTSIKTSLNSKTTWKDKVADIKQKVVDASKLTYKTLGSMGFRSASLSKEMKKDVPSKTPDMKKAFEAATTTFIMNSKNFKDALKIFQGVADMIQGASSSSPDANVKLVNDVAGQILNDFAARSTNISAELSTMKDLEKNAATLLQELFDKYGDTEKFELQGSYDSTVTTLSDIQSDLEDVTREFAAIKDVRNTTETLSQVPWVENWEDIKKKLDATTPPIGDAKRNLKGIISRLNDELKKTKRPSAVYIKSKINTAKTMANFAHTKLKAVGPTLKEAAEIMKPKAAAATKPKPSAPNPPPAPPKLSAKKPAPAPPPKPSAPNPPPAQAPPANVKALTPEAAQTANYVKEKIKTVDENLETLDDLGEKLSSIINTLYEKYDDADRVKLQTEYDSAMTALEEMAEAKGDLTKEVNKIKGLPDTAVPWTDEIKEKLDRTSQIVMETVLDMRLRKASLEKDASKNTPPKVEEFKKELTAAKRSFTSKKDRLMKAVDTAKEVRETIKEGKTVTAKPTVKVAVKPAPKVNPKPTPPPKVNPKPAPPPKVNPKPAPPPKVAVAPKPPAPTPPIAPMVAVAPKPPAPTPPIAPKVAVAPKPPAPMPPIAPKVAVAPKPPAPTPPTAPKVAVAPKPPAPTPAPARRPAPAPKVTPKPATTTTTTTTEETNPDSEVQQPEPEAPSPDVQQPESEVQQPKPDLGQSGGNVEPSVDEEPSGSNAGSGSYGVGGTGQNGGTDYGGYGVGGGDTGDNFGGANNDYDQNQGYPQQPQSAFVPPLRPALVPGQLDYKLVEECKNLMDKNIPEKELPPKCTPVLEELHVMSTGGRRNLKFMGGTTYILWIIIILMVA